VDPDGALSGQPRPGMAEHDLFNGLRELLTSIDGGAPTSRQTQQRQLAPGAHDISVTAVPSSGDPVTISRRVVIARPRLSGSGGSARLVIPAPRVPPANISIPSQVAFDFGSSELRPESQTFLLRMGSLVRRSRGPVRVLGYTDNVGDPEANRRLSLARAQTVRSFLIERVKIPAGRLGAAGRGGLSPIASNETEIGRQRNRRVVLEISTPKGPTVLRGARAVAKARQIRQLEAAAPPRPLLPPAPRPGRGIGIY
jgi:outer membrane protein OmpA-like peptidoglycan-associated protein